MMFFELLLIFPLVAFLLCLVYQNFSFNNEPPVVKSWIPFFGSAFEFSADCATFLAKQRYRLGDIFTVVLGGKRFHIILDETAWDTLFYNKRQDLTFVGFEKQAKQNAFGIRPELSYIPETQELQHTFYIKYLMGKGLDTLSVTMNEHLIDWFKQDKTKHGINVPVRSNLFEFLFRCGFEAGVMTFFGKPILQDNPNIMNFFRAFDAKFAMLFGGAPYFLVKDAAEARNNLAAYMGKANFDGTQCDIVKACQQMFDDYFPNVTDMDKGLFLVGFMWTSHSNTLPSLFWFIYYVFHDSHVLSLVRSEIEGVLEKYDIKDSLKIPREAFKEMPILDSCWQEVLRLRTGSLTMRTAEKSCSIPLPSGESLHVRKGDNIALFPYLHHHDPEIFTNPNEFKYDRFLASDGKPASFYKDGIKLKHSLVAFGGGVSMCPGRFLIANEVKMLAAIMITGMEFQFDPNDNPPVGDPRRCGLGIIPPVADVKVTYRYRS